jgi:hypothetical protein
MGNILALEIGSTLSLVLAIGLAIVIFIIVALLGILARSIFGKIKEHRILAKAHAVAGSLGSDDSYRLYGEELSNALHNSQIAYLSFPLVDSGKGLYMPPKSPNDACFYLAGAYLCAVLPLENYDSRVNDQVAQIAARFNDNLKSLKKKGSFTPVVLLIANNENEASQARDLPNANVAVGLSGLIQQLLKLSRKPSAYGADLSLDILYCTFPDLRLLLREDNQFDPVEISGKRFIDKDGKRVPFSTKDNGDSIYSFHFYHGMAVAKKIRGRSH